MKRYVYSVLLQVEVEAFSEADAHEAVEDCFGEGSNCGLNVLDFEVVDSDEF
ncbi:hypothetical protein PP459_gp146 [Streptomyces phage Wakanda]|uniref:Uncharacterized protein n=2 Tax=Wakandavirus TaxID=3044854 RepID=A0A6G8R386_9CAUD|nr:hypothetical protein PP459_gp146 [Streptomyces phage Wakanda]YP_010652408.1 hypothetical protein PP460_gp150 [Streptomyces phage Muntaha]QIN94087.1 hypothetical protein SEA_WAKANDA_104 [Streptomyces phage Wakanda]QIN94652.1 hypothetical protein SEA_MUNTAHA_106 [Streptomyces phage Muntaha]